LRWLLVFDNVGDYQDIAEFLPPGEGDVLITTRRPNLDEAVLSIEVGAFEPDESVEHLVKRVGIERITSAQAEQVGGSVEHMPIFVALAGAQMADPRTDIPLYRAGLVGQDVLSLTLDGLRTSSMGAFR